MDLEIDRRERACRLDKIFSAPAIATTGMRSAPPAGRRAQGGTLTSRTIDSVNADA
jgi:hypothetical protein